MNYKDIFVIGKSQFGSVELYLSGYHLSFMTSFLFSQIEFPEKVVDSSMYNGRIVENIMCFRHLTPHFDTPLSHNLPQ